MITMSAAMLDEPHPDSRSIVGALRKSVITTVAVIGLLGASLVTTVASGAIHSQRLNCGRRRRDRRLLSPENLKVD